jgi:hypothetical protein
MLLAFGFWRRRGKSQCVRGATSSWWEAIFIALRRIVSRAELRITVGVKNRDLEAIVDDDSEGRATPAWQVEENWRDTISYSVQPQEDSDQKQIWRWRRRT